MSEAVENEYKFTTSKDLDREYVVRRLGSFLDSHDIPYKVKSKRSVDSYYDTDELALFHADCCLRKKVSENGNIKLTIKRPISNAEGMMSRDEIERTSDGSIDDVRKFCDQYFSDLCILEMPVFTVETERTAFDYKDGSGIKLSLDSCDYVLREHRHRFYEIELESMDSTTERGFDDIGILLYIEKVLGFEPTTKSKYVRGIEWKKGLEL